MHHFRDQLVDAVGNDRVKAGGRFVIKQDFRLINNARASPTRLRMPPESSAGFFFSVPSNSTISRTSATHLAISLSEHLPSRRNMKPTFSSTVIESNNAALWNSMPNLRRTSINWRSFIVRCFRRRSNTSPESGWSSASRCFNKTLLPPPLAPMMTTASPLLMRKLTPSKHFVVAKTFFQIAHFDHELVKMRFSNMVRKKLLIRMLMDA